MDKLMKSVDLVVRNDEDYFSMSVVFEDGDEMTINYIDDDIISCDKWDNKNHQYYTLSDNEIKKYKKYMDIFNQIIINNIQYNIIRMELYFLNIPERQVYEDIIYETWSIYNSIDTSVTVKNIYERVIYERGINIDNYDKINDSNSVIITDIRELSIAYRLYKGMIDNNLD